MTPATTLWRGLLPERAEWRAAWRSARRQPLVSATVVVALATGIALATAGFGFLNAVLWGELPFPDGDRFVRLRAYSSAGERGELEPERYRFLREHAGRFAYLGALSTTGSYNVLHADGEVEAVAGAELTPGWFAHLPYSPVAGRLLVEDDGRAGAPPVVVVRESFWRRRLGGDPAAIGRPLRAGGREFLVVGVAPDSFEFPGSGELWLATSELAPDGANVRVAGVLGRATTLEAAAEELDRLSAQFDVAHGVANPPRLALSRATDLSGSGIDVALALLVGLLLLVLLLVASNVANLVVARAAARAGELAVRAALGASRARLVRQLTLEILVLGGFAAVLGLAGAQAILGWIERTMASDELPFWFRFGPDQRTGLFVALVTVGACVVAGALPAQRVTRAPASRLTSGVRAGDRFSRAASFWIVAEMALSVALVASALAVARGASLSVASGEGLPSHRIATAQLSFDAADATAANRREAALAATRALPGVLAAGAGSSLPFLSAATERVEIQALAGEPGGVPRRAPVVAVTAGYLEALAERASAGRLLAAPDFAPGALPVVIVNRPFVERFLGGRAPLGRRLRIDAGDGEPTWREVVGVVPELGLGAGDPDLAAGVYVPMGEEDYLYLAARTAGDAAALSVPLRRALYELDPELSVRRAQPLETVAAEDRTALSLFAAVLTGVGAIALLLSLLGIYAVVSFRVTRRTREIGVRVALGATEQQITRLVVGGAARLFVLGALAGSLLAWALLAVRGAVFVARFPGPGPWLFPAVIVALGAAGVAACWAPVRRALAVEPARALASE